MKGVNNKTLSFESVKEKMIKRFNDYNSVLDECALINTRRIYYLAIIAVPLRIVNILLFAFTGSYDTPILKTWSQGIIASHFILLIFMIGFFLTAHKLKKRTEPSTTMFLLQYISVIVIMASGIAFVTLDQLVTSSITPLLLACIVCGAVFLIRPLISLIIYSISYGTYYYLLALTVTNQQVLLSNRVNGITAVGIGFLISFIIWHYNYINITQKRHIEIQQKQLEQMAYYDSLTGISNRHFFDKFIKQEYSSMERQGHETVIIILDIDNFKNVNDTYGHIVGDKILEQTADLLKDNIRETDIISRFGGEEFVILMPNTSLEKGYDFAERLRKQIMKKGFTIDSIILQITASFGVSLLSDIKNQDLKNYYSLADKALYLAKRQGKNKVVKFGSI